MNGKQQSAQFTPISPGASAAEVLNMLAALPNMGADRDAFAADIRAARTAAQQPLAQVLSRISAWQVNQPAA